MMVSLRTFWCQSHRRIFTLGILVVIALSVFMALLTSGSTAKVVVPVPKNRIRSADTPDVDDFDKELQQWLHHQVEGMQKETPEKAAPKEIPKKKLQKETPEITMKKKTPKRATKKKSRKRTQPKPVRSVKMASTDSDKFNSERVLELFTSCRGDGDILSLDHYVDAYEELCKLFNLFGTVFGFVSSDVTEKIGILRDYLTSSEADSYVTIQDMLTHEVKQGTTASKKKASGSRTLLRLHRALEFISALLVKIKETDNSSKFSTVASKAYDDTLARHHPWLVKKAVHMAMYMLPSRQDLLKKMNVNDDEEGMKALGNLIKELNIIYDVTQQLYAKDNLLDLP